MKSLFLYFSFISIVASAADPVKVAYFGRESESDFQTKIKSSFTESAQCKACEITNWTPYNGQQGYDEGQVVEKLKSLPSDIQIVFFNWNNKTGAGSDSLIAELRKISARGQFVIASAGAPEGDGKTCPLNLTLFGKVEGAIILGELIERDILWPRCFYGPEMLTAIRPPKNQIGQGLGPLLFVSKFAGNYYRRKPSEWVAHFRHKKAATKRIWPELEEFFPH